MVVSPEMFVHLHPESHNEVQNDGRSQRKKRRINKVQTDAAGGYIHDFTHLGADAKCLTFDKIPELIHTYKTPSL